MLLKRTQVYLEPEDAYLRIVSLGKSGKTDVSEQHDRYLAKALHQGRS